MTQAEEVPTCGCVDAVVGLALNVGNGFLRPLVFMYLWSWFAVGFHPTPQYPVCFGLMLMVRFSTWCFSAKDLKPNTGSEKHPFTLVEGINIAVSLLTWGFGYVASLYV